MAIGIESRGDGNSGVGGMASPDLALTHVGHGPSKLLAIGRVHVLARAERPERGKENAINARTARPQLIWARTICSRPRNVYSQSQYIIFTYVYTSRLTCPLVLVFASDACNSVSQQQRGRQSDSTPRSMRPVIIPLFPSSSVHSVRQCSPRGTRAAALNYNSKCTMSFIRWPSFILVSRYLLYFLSWYVPNVQELITHC